MPLYVYQNPKTSEYIEVLQSMKEEHIYIDENGLKWDRVFLGAEISSTKICDPWSNSDFVNQTKNMKGTVGDLMDKSKEMSEMRAKESGGVDPILDKKFKDYSKLRGGIKDPEDPSRKKVFENKHVKIKLD